MARDFRIDINGLRALAVSFVVLYHFGITTISGGFVGVDVFFVISGYLMYGITTHDIQKGIFSYSKFVLARARRIFPALAVLCVCSLIAGWFLLMPKEYQQLGRHVRESLLFSSNIQYLSEAGYFDIASQEKWLLHTWSLSVEWQFYLILPVILGSLWAMRKSRVWLGVVLVVGTLLSLVYSIWLTSHNSSEAFYLLPARAWEMLAGALVAHYTSSITLTTWQARSVEGLGLIAILGSSVFLDHTTLWPGGWALLPVLGAVLVLLANRRESLWTGNKAAQWLGTRSYSIYLWHWPVVVALSYLDQLNQTLWLALGIVLSIVLGAISHRWVEVPSQKWLSRIRTRNAWLILISVLLILVVTAQSVRRSGFAERLPETIAAVDQARSDSNPRLKECLDAKEKCLYGEGPIKLLLVGDSHADSVVTALAQSVSGSVLFRGESGCLVVFGLKSNNSDRDCENLNRALEDEISTLPSNVPLLMVGHTSAHIGFGTFGSKKASFYFSRPFEYIEKSLLDEFASHYVQTLCAMAETRDVYVLRAIPQMPVEVPTYLGRQMLLGRESIHVSESLTQYYQRNAFVRALQDEAALNCGVQILEVTPYLCADGDCPAVDQETVLYRDTDHLTEQGNRRLLPLFKQHFSDL